MNGIVLKPCPFCGKKPFLLISPYSNSFVDRIKIEIRCEECGTTKMDVLAGLSTWEKLESVRDAVVNKWNTRKTNDEIYLISNDND